MEMAIAIGILLVIGGIVYFRTRNRSRYVPPSGGMKVTRRVRDDQ